MLLDLLEAAEPWLHAAAEARPWLLALLSVAAVALAGGHAVLWKRDPRSALGWLALILFLPIAGALIYAIFGVNRLNRKAESLYAGHESVDRESSYGALGPEAVADLGLEELAAYVDRTLRRRLFGGNRVEPLPTGEAAYDRMLGAIESAQRSVVLCTYIFDADAAGDRFFDAVAGAAERGLEVRVLIDSVGDRYTFPPMHSRLKRAGVPSATFLPSLWPTRMVYANLRNHRKLLIADGRLAFTGGMNIRQGHVVMEPPPQPVIDCHFQVEGPVVSSLREVFAEDWAFTTSERLRGESFFPKLETRGEVRARVIDDGPAESFAHLLWTLLGALACARRSVRIVTPYFVPDERLITALNTAARRGVEVEVFLPERNNLLLVQWASTALLWQVLQGGCRVHLVPPPFDHTKLMVVDGAWSLVGSANWDARSLRLNFELDLECYDRELAARLERLVDERRERARQVHLDDVDARSLPVRLRDGLARLASPYL